MQKYIALTFNQKTLEFAEYQVSAEDTENPHNASMEQFPELRRAIFIVVQFHKYCQNETFYRGKLFKKIEQRGTK